MLQEYGTNSAMCSITISKICSLVNTDIGVKHNNDIGVKYNIKALKSPYLFYSWNHPRILNTMLILTFYFTFINLPEIVSKVYA